MLAGVTDCRRSQKWAAKEDGRWDLNLGPAAIEKRPRGSIVVGRTKRFWGRKEETTRLQSKWGGPQGFGGERSRPCGSEVNRENHEVLRGKEEGQDQAALVK